MEAELSMIFELLDRGGTVAILLYALYTMGRSMAIQREVHYEQYEKLLNFLMEHCGSSQ